MATVQVNAGLFSGAECFAGEARQRELRAFFKFDQRRAHTPYGSLAEARLAEADIPRMVAMAMEVRRLLDPNPVEVTPADAARLYQEVLR